jgi:hypothetical protein
VDRVDLLANPFRVEITNLRINLDGISTERTPNPQDYLKIDELQVIFSFTGTFGQRTLWVEHVGVNHLNLHLFSKVKMPEFLKARDEKSSPSVFDALFSFFVFKDVQLRSAMLVNSTLHQKTPAQKVTLSHINVQYDSESNIRGTLNASLVDTKQSIALPQGRVQFTAMAPSGLNHNILSGEIRLSAGQIQIKGHRFSDNNGRIQVGYDMDRHLLQIKKAEINCSVRKLSNDSLKMLLPIQLRGYVNGEVDLAQHQFKQVVWNITADNLGMLKGNVSGNWRENLKVDLAVSDGNLALEPVNQLFSNELGKNGNHIEIKDKIDLQGLLKVRFKALKHDLSGKMTIGLRDNPYLFKNDKTTINGKLNGRCTIWGKWPEGLNVKGRFMSRADEVVSSALNLSSANGGFQFEGRYPNIRIENIGMEAASVLLSLSEKPLSLTAVKLHADHLNLNLKKYFVHLPALYLDADQVTESIQVELKHAAETTSISINTHNSGLVSYLNQSGLLLSNWRFEAREALQADGVFDVESQTLKWQIWCDVNDLTFENPAQTILADQTRLMVKANGKWLQKEAALKGQFKLTGENGEILLDRFYMNFDEHPLNFSGKVNYIFPKENLKISDGIFGLKGIGQVAFDVKSYRVGQKLNWNILATLPATDIAPLYQMGIKDPFELETPFLATVELKGTLQAEADLSFDTENWIIKGRYRLQNGSLELADKNFFLHGIQLDLPIWLTSAVEEQRAFSPAQGKLSISNMKLPYIAEQPLFLDMNVTPNHLVIPQNTRIVAQDNGGMRIWPVTLTFEKSSGLQVDTALDVENWRFDVGVSRLWPLLKAIDINGGFDTIQFKNGNLTSKGSLRTNLFNGIVKIRNPRITQLFSGMPILKMDVNVQDIDLSSLTDQTGFGKIDGVLKGHIDNLEIVNGQPQHFFMLLETAEKNGVPQKISVEAVDNIARIGGGQSPFIGMAGMLATWFKKFNYRKIGVKASLENDMFKVNGLIHENGREYLIKKSGFSGVDIVNSNPDNRIGFKDMVKRIQRVLSPHASPVVQ